MVFSKLSEPTNDFGLRLLEHLSSSSEDKNVLFSPLSIILAYGMLLEGATVETGQQIKKVLQLSSIGKTYQVAQATKKLLEDYKLVEDGSSDRNFSLAIGNLAMVNEAIELKDVFIHNLLTNYFAVASNEDFEDGKAVIDKLNSWIYKKTFGKIKISCQPPDFDTILMLVNTIYFKGQWVEPFKKRDTIYNTFTNSDGTKSKIKSMAFRDKKFNYAHNLEKELKIVDLPYKGDVSMIIILPTESNTLSNLVPTLNSTQINDLMSSMTQTKLAVVKIPKFKLEDTHQLDRILPQMGMNLAFDKTEQRFNIAENPEVLVYISRSVHKSLVEVDEDGTVAASVTTRWCKYTGGKVTTLPEVFVVDRPFLFTIRDNLTGINLFMGQMNKMPNHRPPNPLAIELQPVIEQRTRQLFNKKEKITDQK